jgi:hypothetical protein
MSSPELRFYVTIMSGYSGTWYDKFATCVAYYFQFPYDFNGTFPSIAIITLRYCALSWFFFVHIRDVLKRYEKLEVRSVSISCSFCFVCVCVCVCVREREGRKWGLRDTSKGRCARRYNNGFVFAMLSSIGEAKRRDKVACIVGSATTSVEINLFRLRLNCFGFKLLVGKDSRDTIEVVLRNC